VTFTPDGRALVYSMAGFAVWRQVIGSDEAFELTHPPRRLRLSARRRGGGGSVVFSRYDAMR